MREARIARVAGKQHGAFAHAQALRAGFTQHQIDHRVRAGAWLRVHRGKAFVIAGTPHTAERDLYAAVLAAAPCVVARRSAGRLYGLPGCDPQTPELLVDRDVRLRLHGVDVRRTTELPRSDRTTFGSLPITRPSRTLVDLAAVLSPHELEAAVDHALKVRLVRLDTLCMRFKQLAGSGRVGSTTLRSLLRQRTSGILTESELERDFVRVMRGRIPLPEFQRTITLADGRRVRPDGLYRSVKVALEADSWLHHSTKTEWELDADKRLALRDMGWSIVDFASSDLRDSPDRLARVISAELRARSFAGPWPPTGALRAR